MQHPRPPLATAAPRCLRLGYSGFAAKGAIWDLGRWRYKRICEGKMEEIEMGGGRRAKGIDWFGAG